MKILFVCNNAYHKGNGLSVSVQSTMKMLREHGVDARLMAIRNADPAGPQPDFPLGHFKFPIFEPIIYANGFAYAKIERKVIRRALEWADVVHFEEAFFLEDAVRAMAVKMGKTCTATFHLYPHNVMANLGFSKESFANKLLFKNWYSIVFKYCSDISCPTAEVARYLRANGVQARLHVISNGLAVPEKPVVAQPVSLEPTVEIFCIGRLASEKSQDTLLQAMRYSRYADRIHLTFAGDGSRGRYYKKMAVRLLEDGVIKIPATFGFYTREQLREIARKSYLYVHCAFVEVEGLSCLEATQEGLVPVIGEGSLIGTSSFALCPESLYPERDSRALAERIDWWIEHPEERNQWAQRYADAAREYDINKSIDALIAMFRQAMDDKK